MSQCYLVLCNQNILFRTRPWGLKVKQAHFWSQSHFITRIYCGKLRLSPKVSSPKFYVKNEIETKSKLVKFYGKNEIEAKKELV